MQTQPNVHLVVLAAFCVTGHICRISICMPFHENILKHNLSIFIKYTIFCAPLPKGMVSVIYLNGIDFYTHLTSSAPVGNVQSYKWQAGYLQL